MKQVHFTRVISVVPDEQTTDSEPGLQLCDRRLLMVLIALLGTLDLILGLGILTLILELSARP